MAALTSDEATHNGGNENFPCGIQEVRERERKRKGQGPTSFSGSSNLWCPTRPILSKFHHLPKSATLGTEPLPSGPLAVTTVLDWGRELYTLGCRVAFHLAIYSTRGGISVLQHNGVYRFIVIGEKRD